MSLSKFYPLEELKAKIESERRQNKKIALANGGFDLIHIGHIRYLQAAKRTAGILVVALNSDNSLKKLKGRTIIPEQGRIRLISSFECVDYVTIFDDDRVNRVLLTLKPDFHCKGSDYTVDTVPERETVNSYGGEIAIVGGAKIRSTSWILEEIRSSGHKKAV
ncbi:MAG: adenylyltransferase/cytidyltransferase family protein [Candidatus Aminicenantes bacterium]|nr:adenylyltransferase/cytidyltransferase family protein [Candidatus Aminicenantes bacterium]